MDTMDKLYTLLQEIEDYALQVCATEADQEFNLSHIERLAKVGQKLIRDMQEE